MVTYEQTTSLTHSALCREKDRRAVTSEQRRDGQVRGDSVGSRAILQ